MDWFKSKIGLTTNKSYRCSPVLFSRNCTPLMIMIINRESEDAIINYILANKDEINIQNEKLWTALMILARNSNLYRENYSLNIMKILIDNGASLNIKEIDGFTALMLASGKSYIDSTENTVKLLLDSGADVNIKTDTGSTALMFACANSNTDSTKNTVKMLLDAGADITIRNDKYQTAYDIYVQYQYDYMIKNINISIFNYVNNNIFYDNVQDINDEILSLLKENKRLPINSKLFNKIYKNYIQQNEMCSICLVDIKSIPQIDIVIFKCTHFLCKNCASEVTICPLCRDSLI